MPEHLVFHGLIVIQKMAANVPHWRLWRNPIAIGLKNVSRQPTLNKITKVEDKNHS